MSTRPFLDESAIADACRSYGVRRLELFGSAVRDPEHANDFDFLVDLMETDPGRYAKAFSVSTKHCSGSPARRLIW